MDDPEVKKQVHIEAMQTSWNDELLSGMTFGIKFAQQWKNKVDCATANNNVLSVKLLNEAEAKIVQMVQETLFCRVTDILK